MYKGYIYKWENKINNKVYIGQTMNRYGYRERWSQHRYQAENSIHNNNKFHNAIRKYGIDNFNKEVLECIEIDNKIELKKVLDKIEIKYIEKYDSFNNGYNSTLGGDFNSWNSGDDKYIEKVKIKALETRSRKQLYDSLRIRTDLRLPNNIKDLMLLYDEWDIRYSKYRYTYAIKNKVIAKSKNKDYMYDREHRKIKLYPLGDLDSNKIEEIINTNHSYELGNIDFLDEDIVKCILKLDVNDLKYEYDLETVIIIKDFLNTIYVSNLSDTQLKIFEMYRKGETQQYIADVLGCSRQAIINHLDKIVKKMINTYEKEYSEKHYYLNVIKGKYKKCSKCGEIKLIQYFHKKGGGRYNSKCKHCINKK